MRYNTNTFAKKGVFFEVPRIENFIGKDSDEMYTQYTDIVNELDHYPEELFLGKKILFPCDWDVTYNCGDKIQFITQNKINRIIHITPDADIPKCNFVKYFWETYARFVDTKVELFTSGYNPRNPSDPNNLNCMEVDYSAFDWVITNPPFSFVTDYLQVLSNEAERRKNTKRPFHFLIMIPWQTLGNRLSNFFIEKKAFPGWGKHINLSFLDINKKPILNENGRARFVAVYWITDLDMNFPTVDNNYFVPQHRCSENLHTYFDERLYRPDAPKDKDGHSCASDGFPILVHNKTQHLYYDYPGYQAIPITSIDYYNPRVFEIFASTNITEPCRSLGNFNSIPCAPMLQYRYPGIKKISSYIVKVRDEILQATKGKKPSEVFEVCKDLLKIREVKTDD